MRILELTNYTAGGCGVWARVKTEATLLSNEHTIHVYSTNKTKGSIALAPPEETLGNITIKRFPATKLGGESFMKWNCTKEAIAFHPDIIIAHSYRQYHTHTALRIAKKTGAKLYLVTHAPFGRTRTPLQELLVTIYDTFIGPRILKKYNKIITITHWEEPYLRELNVPEEKILHIPNSINKLYFSTPQKTVPQEKILYIGRISSIKSLETLIEAFATIQPTPITLELFGPAETEYLQQLQTLIQKHNLTTKIMITNTTYTPEQAITELDSARIVVLPSKSEGQPQTLIEAMARKKIIIASNNPGNKELLIHELNGYLFPVGNSEALAATIQKALATPSSIPEAAYQKAQEFTPEHLAARLNLLLSN